MANVAFMSKARVCKFRSLAPVNVLLDTVGQQSSYFT